jgi:N-acetylneuraminic acid mutarotase
MSAEMPLAVLSKDDVLVMDFYGRPCEFPSEEAPPPFDQHAHVLTAATGSFEESAPLDSERHYFVLAPLPGGEVLVTGGSNPQGTPKSSTRIWKPSTGRWVEAALLNLARSNAVGAPVGDGRVVIVGGHTPGGDFTKSAEIYDPAKDSWKRIASMPSGDRVIAAVTLAGGDVVVAGEVYGDDTATVVYRYSPSADRWTRIGKLPEPVETLIPQRDGGMVALGATREVRRWHPDDGWSTAGNLRASRPGAAAALLPDGRVLVAGGRAGSVGEGNARARTTAEVFDPSTGRSEAIASLPEPRNEATGITLQDGTVVIVGGWLDAHNGDTPWCPAVPDNALRWTP